MKKQTIITKEYLSLLIKVAHQYDLPLEGIEIVSSIQEWCKEIGIEEDNPFRAGKCLRNCETGKYKILLAEEITPEMQNSIIGAMSLRDYSLKIEILENPKAFLIHLLLHELAHARNEEWSENECDRWAFEELEKIKARDQILNCELREHL